MARGENPEGLLTIEVDKTGADALIYDKDADFGHASAGKDLVLSLQTDGTAVLGANNEKILGKFVELHPDGTASYMPRAHPMLLRKSATAITLGRGVVCAGGGKVKTGPGTPTASTATNERGQSIKVLETGDNGRILVLMP